VNSKHLPIQELPGTEGLRDSGDIIINLSPSPPELRAKLRLLEDTCSGVAFRFSREPLQDPDISLHLIPLRFLRWLSGPGRLIYKPAFVYGPAHGLYRSFQQGCTDYLREPWDERELLARAERLSGTAVLDYTWGSILFSHGECMGPGGRVLLGPKEALIFRTLIRFRGRGVSRAVLAHLIGGDSRPESRAVDMQICSIRRKTGKILPLQVKTIILTCRPGGYMLR
jgi:hypothetical protein